MKEVITGVVLAGGRGSRLNHRDKGLISVRGRPLIEYVLERLVPQVSTIIINANRNREIYAHYGYPVLGDGNESYDGPLMGMKTALETTKTPWILVVPCDCPQIPINLGMRLFQAATTDNRPIAVATDGKWLQPVFSLLNRQVLPDLQQHLAQKKHKIDAFYAHCGFSRVDFTENPLDFTNLNTPEEIRDFEQKL